MPITTDAMQTWCRALLGDPALPAPSWEDSLADIPRLEDLADLPSSTSVLVRGDLDAKPGAAVGDGDIRLRSMLETLNYGRKRGWKQIVFGHVGREPEKSLAKVAARLGQLLGCDLPLIEDWFDDASTSITDGAASAVRQAAAGSVLMLENARRYAMERLLWEAEPADAPKLAPDLARIANQFAEKLANVYVNEALSAGSLDTSTTIVPAAMRRVALGKYVADQFAGPMRRCLRAQLIVFSGLKTDKLDDLEAAIARGAIRIVFTAGSLAMALKEAAAGLEGKSFSMGLAEDPAHAGRPYYISPERVEQARRILRDGRQRGIEFVLPVDFVLQDGRAADQIGPHDQQFDVGPKTNALFAKHVGEFIEKAKAAGGEPVAAFHNGVFGMFEDPRFEAGTRAFVAQLKRMKDAGLEVYVGGGEGGAALEKYGQPDWVTHTFTAGGTVLNALGSKPVPYLQALSMAAGSTTRPLP